jgi:hypothetical protein
MGIGRIVEVMDHAPPELTAAERLVLLVIAENINDDDPERLTWPGFSAAVLARRTGLLGKGSLKDALQRLAKRGREVRVPIAVGKDGRPLYAVPGRQCRYRLPRLEGEAVASPCPEGEGVPSPGEGETSPKGRAEPRQGRAQPPPTPHPSDSPPPPIPPPPAPDNAPSAREGGRADAPPPEEQAAAQALARAVAGIPQLALGVREIARLAPLVVPWLGRTTETALRDALTAGLPAVVGNPSGIVRRRLLDKLPPAAAPPRTDGLPPWCGLCGDGMPARFNARFRVRQDGGLCGCHPDAA